MQNNMQQKDVEDAIKGFIMFVALSIYIGSLVLVILLSK